MRVLERERGERIGTRGTLQAPELAQVLTDRRIREHPSPGHVDSLSMDQLRTSVEHLCWRGTLLAKAISRW